MTRDAFKWILKKCCDVIAISENNLKSNTKSQMSNYPQY